MIEVKMFHNDPCIPNERMLELLHSAFKERIEQGINFGCATYTMEEYKNETKNAYLFVAYNEEYPVGSITIKVKRRFGIKYGSIKYVATSSNNKRKGIGTMLLNAIMDFAKDQKLLFLISATALNAVSSVKWHKKNGFVPFLHRKFQERNYSSIVFLNPISPFLRTIFWGGRLPVLYISKLYISFVKID